MQEIKAAIEKRMQELRDNEIITSFVSSLSEEQVSLLTESFVLVFLHVVLEEVR